MYRLGQRRDVHGSLRDAWERLWSSKTPVPSGEFWALRDVSLEVAEGEVLGLIGRNGAGKSTLLKILSRITPPTVGVARIRGSVGSLLEVGAGFHPELTGRENVYMNGSILGMSRIQIRERFDEIVDFAGVEQFLDTPVKRYSSGMYVRLAFAVAAHLEPDVLIVDEVLAVGDAAFQKKCLSKMDDASRGGRTVLFVSHNMAAVQSLCSRAVLLERGGIVVDGSPSEVIHQYMGGQSALSGEHAWDLEGAPRSGLIALRAVRVRLGSGAVVGAVACSEAFGVELEFDILQSDPRIGMTIVLRNSEGVPVFTSLSSADPEWPLVSRPVGLYRSTCWVCGNLLAEETYSISVVFWSDNYQLSLSEQDVLSVSVEGPCRARGDYMGRFDGVVAPVLSWATSAHTIDDRCVSGEDTATQG
ncbi:MAG: lipopolysaccharide transport system ATP-binding [Actinobacteria bacterium]|nr:MAG: lipopolysaccharide transport system ATP-binding [Actinomycetota bacterium]